MAGGGAPATGTGQGQTVFTPPGQPTAAFNFGQILSPFIDTSTLNAQAAGNEPTAPYVIPQAFGATGNIIDNPYAGGALSQALDANNLIVGGAVPNAIQGANTLQGLASLQAGQAGGIPGLTYGNPAYAQAEGLGGFYGPAYAQRGDQYGQSEAALGLQAGLPLIGSQQQLLDLGFDPQRALYNQSRGQTLDAANVANAMSGTANTPYGASVDANALGNFDINWQNQAQARANAGAQAAGAAGATGLSDVTTGYGTGLNLATSGLQAGQGSLLTPANNQTAAALQGTSALGNLTSGAGAGFAGANNLITGGAANLLSYGQQPYNLYQGQQGNNLSALANLTSLTGQQYALPQQTLQDLESYLGLGQSASTIANQIGATNFNEQLAGLQGIGGGIGLGNSLLGNPLGGVGSSLFGGLGGGGGGAAAIDAATGIPTGVGGLDIAGGGGLADVATAAGGGSSFAPLAFLGS